MDSIMRDVNGLVVPQRQKDGYINGTQLCKAAGKPWGNYYRLESTKEYLQALSADLQICISGKNGLVQIRKGGKPEQQGTWVHPEVAVDLAQWLSPQFRIVVNRWVREWLTDKAQPRQHQQLWWDRLALFQTHTKIPDGYWCVYMELHLLLVQELEVKGFVFPKGACPDISVGRCWCEYLRRQENIEPNEFPYYEHHYPDQRGKQSAHIYPDSLLPLFRRWLRATYVPGQFPAYVRQLCSPEECNMVAAAIGYEVKPIRPRLSAE